MCAAQARPERNPDNRLSAVPGGKPFSADPEHEALRLPLATRADPASLPRLAAYPRTEPGEL